MSILTISEWFLNVKKIKKIKVIQSMVNVLSMAKRSWCKTKHVLFDTQVKITLTLPLINMRFVLSARLVLSLYIYWCCWGQSVVWKASQRFNENLRPANQITCLHSNLSLIPRPRQLRRTWYSWSSPHVSRRMCSSEINHFKVVSLVTWYLDGSETAFVV